MGFTQETLTRIHKLANDGPPPTVDVYPDSIPVPFFGRLEDAVATTLTMNPATDEFSFRPARFETLSSLGVASYASLTLAHIKKQIERCGTYFEGDPNPWFTPLETLVRPLGLGFSESRATKGFLAHLDISSWCTTKGFGSLNAKQKESLRASNSELLFDLLRASKCKALLVNGDGTHKQLLVSLARSGLRFVQPRIVGGAQSGQLDLYRGELTLAPNRTVRLLAWDPFMQRGKTADWVRELQPRVVDALKDLF